PQKVGKLLHELLAKRTTRPGIDRPLWHWGLRGAPDRTSRGRPSGKRKSAPRGRPGFLREAGTSLNVLRNARRNRLDGRGRDFTDSRDLVAIDISRVREG